MLPRRPSSARPNARWRSIRKAPFWRAAAAIRKKSTPKSSSDCAKEGDATAKQVFDDYVKALAHGIVSIFNMLDPEVIVLGGGVSMAGEYLLDAVRAAVKPLVFFKTLPYPSIQLARLGADAGIIGAALLGRA